MPTTTRRPRAKSKMIRHTVGKPSAEIAANVAAKFLGIIPWGSTVVKSKKVVEVVKKAS